MNQRLVLTQIGDDRVEAFAQLVTAYLRNMNGSNALLPANTAINTTLKHIESFDAIADARRDLHLALAFSVRDVGHQNIHLPFLSR